MKKLLKPTQCTLSIKVFLILTTTFLHHQFIAAQNYERSSMNIEHFRAAIDGALQELHGLTGKTIAYSILKYNSDDRSAIIRTPSR